jgi:ABC-type amino acid transport substrate-binding protein
VICGNSGAGRRALSGLGKALAVTALAVVAGAWSLPAQAWEMKVCSDPDLLPFSKEDGTGFENRIAEILAKDLGAKVTYVWFPASEAQVQELQRTGECDLVMGVADGYTQVSTLAYYRSPFVFVHRPNEGYNIEMFDDPDLTKLKVGVQPGGGPTQDALMTRGLGNIIAEVYETGLSQIIEDVASRKIDVAITWGPGAAYFASLQNPPLVVNAVTPEFEPPFIPMFINMVIGLRRGDEAFRDLLDLAITRNWDALQAEIEKMHVPLMPLAAPVMSLEP